MTATKCCLKIEAELDNINAGLYRMIANRDQTYGVAEAIEDHSNLGLTEIIGVNKTKPNGTVIRADVKFRVPQCGDGGADPDVTFDCTDAKGADTQQDFDYDTFTFDDHVSDKWTIDAKNFDAECETPDQHFAMQFANRARQLYQRYNGKLAVLAAASVGHDYTSTTDTALTPLGLKLIYNNPETGVLTPQPMAVSDISNQYDRMGFRGMSPIVISGARAVETYIASGALFRGNSWGFDPNRQDTPSNIYQDYQLAAATGATALNPILTLMPGTFDLIEFFEFDTEYRQLGPGGRATWVPTQASGTIVRQKVDLGPAIGNGRSFIVDMQLVYDEHCNEIEVRWRKDFGLWTLPTEAFCAGDTYNGKLLWDVVAGAYTSADVLAA
ncbi:MAG: hypothetical protein ACWA44_02460 [Thiotrichales bacterium]